MNIFSTAMKGIEKKGATFKAVSAAIVIVPLFALSYAAVSQYYEHQPAVPGAAEKLQKENAAAARPHEARQPAGGKPQIGKVAGSGHAEYLRRIKEDVARQRRVMEQHIQLANELNWKRYVVEEGIDDVPGDARLAIRPDAGRRGEAAAAARVTPEQVQPQSRPNQEPYLAEEKPDIDIAHAASGNESHKILIQQVTVWPSVMQEQNQPPREIDQNSSLAADKTGGGFANALPDVRPDAGRRYEVAASVSVMPQQSWHPGMAEEKSGNAASGNGQMQPTAGPDQEKLFEDGAGDQIVEEIGSDQLPAISTVKVIQ